MGVRVGAVVAVEGGDTDVPEGRLVEVGVGWLVEVGTAGVLAGTGVAEGTTGVNVTGGLVGVGTIGSAVGVNRGKVGSGGLGVGVENINGCVAVAPDIGVGVSPAVPGVGGSTVGLTVAATTSG